MTVGHGRWVRVNNLMRVHIISRTCKAPSSRLNPENCCVIPAPKKSMPQEDHWHTRVIQGVQLLLPMSASRARIVGQPVYTQIGDQTIKVTVITDSWTDI